MARYLKPDWFTKRVANRLMMLMMRAGMSARGSRMLSVRGRKTGKVHTWVVNPLEHEGGRYLVAPRGNTQWARNLRAAGGGELRLGSKREQFQAVEVADEEKAPILRDYLTHWQMETGKFFDGVGPEAPEEELRRIAPDHPVFRLTEWK